MLRFILEPKMSSMLNKVPRTDDRNVYSVALGWSSLMISICSILYIVQFNSYSFCLFWVGLLVTCLTPDDLSVREEYWSYPQLHWGYLSLCFINSSAMSTQCLYPQSNPFINMWCPSLSLRSSVLCKLVSLGRGRATPYFICLKSHYFCFAVCLYFYMCL